MMVRPPDKPKKAKDPAKPTRSKAARPDAGPLDRALADLLNPAIGQGRAGVGSQTGQDADASSTRRQNSPNPSPQGGGERLKPPSDNSFDRRADFANAHRARASVARGFGEAPQQGYVGKTPVPPGELDPDLARALGIDEQDDEPKQYARNVITPGMGPAHLRLARPAAAVSAAVAGARQPAVAGPIAARGPRRNSAKRRRQQDLDAAPAAAAGKIRRRPPLWSSSRTSSPKGDQPQAIAELVEGVRRHERDQVLLGVTGSGKTFTMAKVIEATQRPALILAPNKTLAAQLYGEFKSFFPDNAVEYFVSYYDYYQPEAYVPRTDTYIEKESSINEQIDRMRHAATRALLERDDVIIVASVSCIYGIGSVETYSAMTFSLKRGERIDQRAADRRPGRAAIQALRRRLLPRRLPRARRRDRDFSRALRGPRLARVAVRRRDRVDRTNSIRSPGRRPTSWNSSKSTPTRTT